jgi:hypothetical protein
VQFSLDVAQVRAIARGPSVDVIAVMRGADPKPSPAVRREMLSYLVGLATPSLGARDRIAIDGPTAIVVRISLALAITAIERSGTVGREIAKRLAALLDPATGGLDGAGWPLGARLEPYEVSAALDGVPDLETILRMDIARQNDDRSVTPLDARLGPADLLVLGPDSLEFEFAVAETEAAV